MKKKEIKEVVNKIYSVFDCFTDLGAEDRDVKYLKENVEKIIKKLGDDLKQK